MAKNDKERRQFSRVNFETQVLLSQGDALIQAEVQDISLNGLLIKTPKHYHLRSDLPCRAKILLANNIHIEMQVTLVHSSDASLGLHCTSIDMESIAHLRRLIEANMQEPNACERVLAELVEAMN
jgi:bifunctional N-acetylglucosamine-1-phosphate-uridyltransferase/glucosamine-1-phosphate-acetyltransferase GlmU-like protein